MQESNLHQYFDAYFNGSLSPQEEAQFFGLLSSNSEARTEFKQQHFFSSCFQAAAEPFPEELDERILQMVGKQPEARPTTTLYQTIAAAAGFAAITCIAIVYMLFTKIDTYNRQIDGAMLEIKNQKQTIELLMNSLPTLQVTSNKRHDYPITNY